MQVVVVAHALATLARDRFAVAVRPDRTAFLAAFHDAEEVITGDVPTPIKYFSPEVAAALSSVDAAAKRRLLDLLPEDLRGAYQPALVADPEDAVERSYVKHADRICAYLKCVEERSAGNTEFGRAEATIRAQIDAIDDPAVQAFMEIFVPSFSLTLDELH